MSLDEGPFERLRSRIERLSPSTDESSRDVVWANSGESVGVSRDARGRMEIFIAGSALHVRSPIIDSNLAHNRWTRSGHEDVEASRLLLPSASHFDPIAAFVCVELLDQGAEQDVQAAFTRAEPIIEMALQRLRLQSDSLLGLLGELLVLDALLAPAAQGADDALIGSWFGHQQSTRDFQVSGTGLEVKTTRGLSSKHKVQGVWQVEPGFSADGSAESGLLLVSIGLTQAQHQDTSGHSLVSLTDGILAQLEIRGASVATRGEFLHRLNAYGLGDGDGYDHEEMRDRLAYNQRWAVAFMRSYDMSDRRINVLRSEDLAPYSEVDPSSVEFTVTLPEQVDGDLNPLVGPEELSRAVNALP